MKFKHVYNVFVLATVVFLAVFFVFNREHFKGYTLTLALFLLSSAAVILKKEIKFSALWLTLPLSILIVSVFFRVHQYPEVMILALNRLYIAVLSMLPFKKIKIHPFVLAVYYNIIVFFLFLEIVLSIVYVIHPFEILKRKTDIFRLVPSSTFNNAKVNESGYMGRPATEPKKEERIFFTGDSFGVGVVDYKFNFIQMIDDSTEYECINMSQPGYSPIDYLREIKENLKKSHADRAVIVIFAGNDIANISLPENNWSFENLKFVNLARNIKTVSAEKENMGSSRETLKMTKEKFIEVEEDRMKINVKGAFEKEWKLFEKTIKEIKAALLKENVEFTCVVIPDEYSVNDNLYSEITKENPTDRYYSINKIMDILQRNSINCINTTGALQELNLNGINPYKENDTHINEAGNYIIFNEIRKHLDFNKR